MNVLGLQFGVLKRANWLLLLAMLALVVIGVLFIRSACAARQEAVIRGLYRMQIVWAAAGAGAAVWAAANWADEASATPPTISTASFTMRDIAPPFCSWRTTIALAKFAVQRKRGGWSTESRRT